MILRIAAFIAIGAAALGGGEERPWGVVADCSTRSIASFPGAFSDRANVVVGPLVLVGATRTSAATIREFGGNKFPLLVRAGHRVTLELPPEARRTAALAYGPLPEGYVHMREAHRVVRFVACPRGPRATFWSGGVLTRSPRCVPLRVWVDREPAPRRIWLRMGVPRCP